MDDVRQPDMFGHTASQRALFDEPVPSSPRCGHTRESIRALMLGLLEEARSATTMPWDARALRGHTAMFPYMAEWLSKEEGAQLLLEFRAEVDRLRQNAET